MNKKEIAEKALRERGSEMTLLEIAEYAQRFNLISDPDKTKTAQSFGSAIATDIKRNKNKSIFRKVHNGKGGYKKGVYKLKRELKSDQEKIIKTIKRSDTSLIPNVSNLYVGKGGEFAVQSELLFRGYNANIMSVDEGIDIVASKENRFFYIQVKTVHYQTNKLLSSSIKIDRFNKFERYDTYYVIVIRYYNDKSSRNDYIILRSTDLERFIALGILNKEKNNLILNIKIDSDKFWLSSKIKKEDLSYHFNNFDLIK